MTREEVIKYFKRHIRLYCVTGICREAEEMAVSDMTAISALSADLKAVDRDSMDEKTLIGFNMALALMNKHLGGAEVTLNVTDTNVGNIDKPSYNSIKTELDGNLISRKDLLSWLDSTLEHSDKMFDSEIATLKAVKDRVVNMPSVVRENRTGHWIPFKDLPNHYYCSECNYASNPELRKHKFCCNCGARMDGGGEA